MPDSLEEAQEAIIARLIKDPYPLYDRTFPLIMFWSPKGGCTSLMKWFFFQIGLHQITKDYHPWIHKYRMEVHEKQNNYRNEIQKQLLDSKKETYKLVRNPFTRAVSSFFAMLTNKAILDQLAPNAIDGISFTQFLYMIKQKGVGRSSVDLHIAQQYIDEEESVIKNYIYLEDFTKELRNIEKKFGLLKSPMSDLIKSPHHMSEIMTEYGESADTKFTPNSFGNRLPIYKSFYNDETRDLVSELFKKDFQAYGYDQTELK
ncbi:sulfotransferase family 2 domain-containing protein [Peribacillus frigoritolerans]|uniref:sulfotransferase family 2 domain-containing protein n=1 Tax=Peribacillus frigoritolerans TaxID=450367 RepID=UPI003D060369